MTNSWRNTAYQNKSEKKQENYILLYLLQKLNSYIKPSQQSKFQAQMVSMVNLPFKEEKTPISYKIFQIIQKRGNTSDIIL